MSNQNVLVYEFEIKSIPYGLSTYSFMNRVTLILLVWTFLWWSNTFFRILYFTFQHKIGAPPLLFLAKCHNPSWLLLLFSSIFTRENSH